MLCIPKIEPGVGADLSWKPAFGRATEKHFEGNAFRIEIDRQESGKQFVTVEDTTGRFRASQGQVEPAKQNIQSEPRIVAGLAEATLKPNDHVNWKRGALL